MAGIPPIVQQPTNSPLVQQPGNYTPNQQYSQQGYYGQQQPNMGMGMGMNQGMGMGMNQGMGMGMNQGMGMGMNQGMGMGMGMGQMGMGMGMGMGMQGPPVPTGPPPDPIPGVPIGLEPLVTLGHLFVKQQPEIMEMALGIETPNKYDILTGTGERIYFAAETTSYGAMKWGGANRPFTIDILDFFGRKVMILNRVDAGCNGEMFVTLGDGSKLGTVTQQRCCCCRCCCKAEFHITDSTNAVVMVINGPNCGDACAGVADYPITTKKDRANVGVIRKTFSGFVQEALTDADNFGVEFPPDLTVHWKALMFAAVFLIDFLFFETTAHRPHHHRHGGVGVGVGVGHGRY